MLLCAGMVVPIYTASGVKSVWTAIALISIAAARTRVVGESLHHVVGYVSAPRGRSVVGIGGMADRWAARFLLFYAGHILQLTHSYASLFGIAASAYLLALIVLCLLAPD